MTKTGAGTFILTGANSYGGTTRVAVGTLATAGSERIADASALVVDAGATLRLGGSETAASLAGAGSVVTGAAGSLLSVGGGNASTAFDGIVSGSGGLTKTGAGTLTLSGANSHGGGTRVAAGTLKLRGASASPGAAGASVVLDADAVLDIADGASVANAVTSRGAVVANSSGTGTLTGALMLAADGSRVGSAAGAGGLTVAGAIGESGSARSLAKVDAGTVVLAAGAANTYTGTTRLDAGTLVVDGTLRTAALDVRAGLLALGSAGRLLATPVVTVAAGATLGLGGDETVGSLAGAGGVDLGAATLTTGSAADSTFSGVLSGSGGLTKQGSSTFVLAGDNRYGGTTRVAAGTLGTAGDERIADASALVVDAGAMLRLGGSETAASLAGAGSVVVTDAGSTLSVGGGNAGSVFDGVVSGSGGLTKTGSGTLALSGANAYVGTTVVEAGMLAVGGTLQSALLDVRGGTLTLASAGRLLAAPGVAVARGATLALGGDETAGAVTLGGTLAGSATLNAGSVNLNGATVASNLRTPTLASRGASRLDGSADASKVAVDAGSLTLGAAERLADGSTVTVAGGATLVLGGSETIGSLAGAGSVALGSGMLATGSAGDSRFSGTLAGSGGLVKQGASTFILAGANGYGGGTTIAAGTLAVGDGGSAGTLGSGPVTNDGLLRFQRSDAVTIASTIVGRGALVQAGSGVLTLAGTGNAYSGGTTVAAGTLATAGDRRLPSAGDVAVAAGTRLALGGSENVASLRADGEVSLGGSLAATGDLLLHGPVTVTAAAPIGLTGRTIEAASDGNRWGAQPLSIDASLLTLSSGRSPAGSDYLPLNLGSVGLAAGGTIDAGSLLVGSTLALNGGMLTLTAHGMPSYTLAGGSQSLTPQGQPLAFADDVIAQAAGSRLTSAAGAMLKLQAPAGASIGLTEDGNDLRGPVSALSGPAWNTAWAANLQNVGGTPAAAQGRVRLAGSRLLVGGQGIEADMVALRAGSIAMDGTASTITARLPYDNLLGTAVSVPGLTFELTDAAFATAFSYGRPDAEIRVSVGSAATGGRGSGSDAGLLTVLPRGGARGSHGALPDRPGQRTGVELPLLPAGRPRRQRDTGVLQRPAAAHAAARKLAVVGRRHAGKRAQGPLRRSRAHRERGRAAARRRHRRGRAGPAGDAGRRQRPAARDLQARRRHAAVRSGARRQRRAAGRRVGRRAPGRDLRSRTGPADDRGRRRHAGALACAMHTGRRKPAMRTPVKPDTDAVMTLRSTDKPPSPDDRPTADAATPGGLLPPAPAGRLPAADAAPAAPGSGWRQVRRRLCQWPLATGALALSTAAVAQATEQSPNAGAAEARPASQVRLALVMGNQVYPPPHDLPPVHKNVRDLDAALKKRGFEVSAVLDVDAPRAAAGARRVRRQGPRGAAGLRWCSSTSSGHGAQVDAENLLVSARASARRPCPTTWCAAASTLVKDVVGQLPLPPGGPDDRGRRRLPHLRCATCAADDGPQPGRSAAGLPDRLCHRRRQAGDRAQRRHAEHLLHRLAGQAAAEFATTRSRSPTCSARQGRRAADVMQNHPVELLRRVAQVPFIAENLHVIVPLAPRRIAANQPERDAAPALFASASERDDYAQLSKSLWPAEIVRLADRFRQRFPNSRVAAGVEVMRRGAAEAAQILRPRGRAAHPPLVRRAGAARRRCRLP